MRVLAAGAVLIAVVVPAATAAGATPNVTSHGKLKGPASGIVSGPDGALWHTSVSKRVGRTTIAGETVEWKVKDAKPGEITQGPDGALWFVQGEDSVGRVTTAGAITRVGDFDDVEAKSIAAGPDGNLWFTAEGVDDDDDDRSDADDALDLVRGHDGAIGRVTPGGETSLFTDGLASRPQDITAGPDGALWFTEPDDIGRIGRITPTGQITEFTAGLTPGRAPTSITAGPDGALWFTEPGGYGAIGRIAPDGKVTEYTTGLAPWSEPRHITSGPDGALWFTLKGGIGRISTLGAISTYETPGMDPRELSAAPDGGVWFTNRRHPTLGRISLSEPPVGPAAPDPDAAGTTPEPELGKTVVAAKLRGVVRFRVPGRRRLARLKAGSSLPVGSLIDTRRGRVELRSAVDENGAIQTGRFGGGLFKVRQPANRNGLTQILLRGRLSCRTRASLASTAGKKSRRRRVWGSDSGGKFSTHGRDSVTTVRGTRWLTEDRCKGTLTRVAEGSVVVRDRRTGKRVVLHAGERHLARHKR